MVGMVAAMKGFNSRGQLGAQPVIVSLQAADWSCEAEGTRARIQAAASRARSGSERIDQERAPSRRRTRKDAAVMTLTRHGLTAAAIRWCSLSVAWAVIVGSSSVVAGLAASSLALLGLGANAVLDGTASAVLVWRFRHERLGAAEIETVERRAALAVGALMIAVGAYLMARSVGALAEHSAPDESAVGIGLAAGSVLVLPVFARAKLRLAARLQSSALRGDGVLSLAGGVLAAATLLSLVLDAAFDWWWADAVAALLIAAMLFTEGRGTIVSGR
jgi:divalent metal cation (Fe/Co/Zn/Cd) transporter